MTRAVFIERALRQIYNGYPSDDSEVTEGLVNSWLNDAIGVAAKSNYAGNLQMDGIGYVNNSFYTTFSNIPITNSSNGVYSASLPEIPVGIGKNEGISTLEVVDEKGRVSFPLIPLSASQRSFFRNMQVIPNKVLYFNQGSKLEMFTTINLANCTLNVTMISGGDSTDLNSELNVPPDYFDVMTDYISKQILGMRMLPKDLTNDGRDLAS